MLKILFQFSFAIPKENKKAEAVESKVIKFGDLESIGNVLKNYNNNFPSNLYPIVPCFGIIYFQLKSFLMFDSSF